MPSLRSRRLFSVVYAALGAASTSQFRVLQFSVQSDHLHLLVEANGPTEFERGVRGLAVRIARAVNRVLVRRGRVRGDRYHARMLTSPREMRNALVYVLNNVRKHLPRVGGFDPCSSAAWFDGWVRWPTRAIVGSAVAPPRSWLARVGWRKGGLIGVDESPADKPQPSRRR